MTELHMISTTVDLKELRRLCAVRGFAADEGRALHHVLAETFGVGIIKSFRLMSGKGSSHYATLYAYGTQNEIALRDSSKQFGTPEHLALLNMSSLRSKPMPQDWSVGQRLSFDVRVKPVRRLKAPLQGWQQPGDKSPSPPFKAKKEVDAYLVAAFRQFPDGPPEGFNKLQFRSEAYRKWLAERLESAAALKDVTIKSMGTKPVLREGRLGVGPDATFHGELTIVDPVAFNVRLKSGVGRHTAYGFGMLLLRPARS